MAGEIGGPSAACCFWMDGAVRICNLWPILGDESGSVVGLRGSDGLDRFHDWWHPCGKKSIHNKGAQRLEAFDNNDRRSVRFCYRAAPSPFVWRLRCLG